jgi:hypothetical protein
MAGREKIALDHFGPSEQAAIRAILTEFRHRGWHDAGAALTIVRVVAAARTPVSARRLVAAVPGEFLTQNRLRRSELEGALIELAGRSGVTASG